MHTAIESQRILWAVCAGNDALMGHASTMKPSEIGMVMGQHGTLLGNGIRENVRIADTLASATGVLDGVHVVSEAAKFLDNRQRKILVGIEPGHEWSVCLVGENVVVDLGGMLPVIVPSRLEVFGREPHDVLQDLLVRRTEAAGIHQAPNGTAIASYFSTKLRRMRSSTSVERQAR